MLEELGIITAIIIFVTIYVSYKGLNDERFMDRYKFDVDRILTGKEYVRLISSGFLHVSWIHLIFNLVTLYFFSGSLESYMSSVNFIILYLGSLLGGNLLCLYLNRSNEDYTAVGASGAVAGLIFASISLFQGMDIRMFYIPFYIPAWVFGMLYILFTIYGIRKGKDRIGHEAHLGGAITGTLLALLMEPDIISYNWATILLILIPCAIFIGIIFYQPNLLLIPINTSLRRKADKNTYDIDHLYNAKRSEDQRRIDSILEKVKRKGFDSLSKKEKDLLRSRVNR